jgi:uncharacterized protein (TIGR01244 family)
LNKQFCTRLQAYVASGQSQLVFHPVTAEITLAGQPQPDDWARLAEDGFDAVINMRSDPERAALQARAAQQARLDYIHLNLPAYELEPEHIRQFRDVLYQANNEKILIHCRTGSRVGLVWMLHRVLNEGWSQQAAEAELVEAGYDEDDLDTFAFCAEDYFERSAPAPA